MYVIYKNLAYASPQLYYARDNIWSANTLFESLYLQVSFLLAFVPVLCLRRREKCYKHCQLNEPGR